MTLTLSHYSSRVAATPQVTVDLSLVPLLTHKGDYLRFMLPFTGGFIASLGQLAPGQDRDCLSTFVGGLLLILQFRGLILPVLPETRVL